MEMFDLHCDTILECMQKDKNLFGNDMHIDLSRLPKGTKYAQVFAIFTMDNLRGDAAKEHFEKCLATYIAQTAKNSDIIGRALCYDDILRCFEEGKFAAILAVEGGACIAGEMEMLEHIYDCGVRMMTITWNGANEIAAGCGAVGGFTDFGKKVVARMEEMGMVVDVSHLNDQSFFELCEFATKPFIATHSNSRSICAHRRNLTDEQFCKIRDCVGIVGMNYYHDFIKDGGGSTDISDLTAHVKHFLDLGGEDIIALGSDFDGAFIPDYINGVQKTGNLKTALLDDGIDSKIVDKIFFGNASRFFEKYIK